MGLGPPIIALYHQLKTLGVFNGVRSVVELGSQTVWCPQRTMMRNLFCAFGREAPRDAAMKSFANGTGAGRDLYEHLGMTYTCIDVDARFGSLKLEMNFDAVPPEHRGRYDLTTNHGTSEHILNQYNVFKMMHELTSTGGLILHAVPFTAHLEHGFFNYNVDFFSTIARANSYRTLGVWIGPDWDLSSLVPWDPSLMAHLTHSGKTTHLLVVLQRKTAATEFRPPLGLGAGERAADWWTSPYCHVVDAEYYDGARDRFVSLRPAGDVLDQRLEVTEPPAVEPVSNSVADAPRAGTRATPFALTPSVVALYRQLKALRIADGVHSVLELGSSPLDCPPPLVAELLRAFGRPDAAKSLKSNRGLEAPRSRNLYEALGWTCTSVGHSGEPATLKLDLEFETVPSDLANRYDLVTNIGVGAGLLNQHNVFAAAHAFARPGGLMLHVLPFKIPPRGALFGYQPNFFEALARYNSYRTLGTWVAVDPHVPSFIPWQPSLLDYLVMSEETAHTLVVLFQKMYANDFCVPFQGCYETLVPPSSLARYRMVIDGTYSDGAAALAMGKLPRWATVPSGVTLKGVPGIELVQELKRRLQPRLTNLISARLRQAFVKPAVPTKSQPNSRPPAPFAKSVSGGAGRGFLRRLRGRRS